ncbi:MAG: DNA primase [Bacteroidia bacterium]|nr:DNA primase [Bacteroidia bacterium]
MIDQATVGKIIESTEIISVIQEFVPLKKRGVNYLGLCPFHNEKTPSFTVSPAKGIFKCFGCGKGGNAVTFVMEHEHITYWEALKFLAHKYHITVEEKEETPEDIALKNERESLFIVTAWAQKYFSETLHASKEGNAIGMAYFRERGFREDIIEKFQLGYCTDSRDEFTLTALKNGYLIEYLVKSGLTIQKEDKVFDRFSGRIMFPIHGISGRTIAFGGRTLRTDKTVAKYVNSPESEIYHKSRIVYGISHAKNTIIRQDKCFLVEGYTDVISLHQAGIENVVASSGTSLTVDQIRLIKRFTNNITIMYDGDEAGIKASLRGIDLVLEEGINVKVLLFPDGEDPDSFSRKVSSSELLEFISKNETDFILFKTKLLIGETKSDPLKKAGLINDIVQSVAVIPDKITRAVYLKECSTRLNVEEQALYSQMNRILRKKTRDKHNIPETPADLVQKSGTNYQYLFSDKESNEVHEREIIRLLIRYGNSPLITGEDKHELSVGEFIISELHKEEEILEFRNPLYRKIFEEAGDLLRVGYILNDAHYINHYDENIGQLAVDFIAANYPLSQIWRKRDIFVETEEARLNDLVPECIMAYKNRKVNELMKENAEKLKTTTSDQEMNDLLRKYSVLKKINMELSKVLGERTIS